MTNKNIIVLGQQDWEVAIGSNNINIAKEFAKGNKVIYVNNALDRKTIYKKKQTDLVQKKLVYVASKNIGLEEVEPNLWVLYPYSVMESVNWLPDGMIYNYINKINNRRLAKNIKLAATQLQFDDFYLFNDSLISKGLHQKELLNPKLYIYYSRDNFSTQPYFQKHALREEKELMRKADVILTNSGQLAEIASKENTNCFNIGQGCDIRLFDVGNLAVAPEMLTISKPIIGYTGYLTSLRLDIDLLEFAATSNPAWQFVFIGTEDARFKESKLHQLNNVHFLGNKHPDCLPEYIRAFDVSINPQLVNEFTNGNYPRKIDEYLAMGKPVVATKTNFMSYFADYCYLSSDKQSFVTLIQKALTDNHPALEADRIAFAQTHSWEKNVDKIYDVIESIDQ